MVIYKCDNCGSETNAEDGSGNTFLRDGLVVVRVQAMLVRKAPNKADAEIWLSPAEDDKVHICPRCVFDAARNGVVTRWNPVERRGVDG